MPERHGRVPDGDAESGERFLVRRDGDGAFAKISLLRFGRDGKIVYKRIVEETVAAVVEKRADMIDGSIPCGLAALRHKIHHVDLDGIRRVDRLADAGDEKIRNNARIKAAGAEHDEVCLPDGVETGAERHGVLRRKICPHNAPREVFFVFGNLRFARDGHAVVEIGEELHVFVCDRQHAPGDGEHLAHARDGLVKRIAHAVERGEKEIAEALTAQRAVPEPVGEQRLHRRLGVRERLQAVADVAGREHAELLPEHAAAAAVVHDGDDGGNGRGNALQAAQHGGKSGTAADGDDLYIRTAGKTLFHCSFTLSRSRQMSRAFCPCSSR